MEAPSASPRQLATEATCALERQARAAIPILADWCVVDVPEGGQLRRVVAVHADGDKEELLHDIATRYPVRSYRAAGLLEALRDGAEAELYADITHDALFRFAEDAAHFEALLKLGPESAIVVPLRMDTTVLGVCSFGLGAGRTFTDDDLQAAERWAEGAAPMLERVLVANRAARAEHGLADARARASMLREAAAVISESQSFDRVIATIVAAAARFGDFALLHLADHDGELRQAGAAHRDAARADLVNALARLTLPRRSDAAIARAVAGGRPETAGALLGAVNDSELASIRDALSPHAFIAAPLRARGRTLGAVTVVSATRDHDYARDAIEDFGQLAATAALAIAGALLQRDADAAFHEKNEFLATVSHELRTPLHAIVGWSRFLLRGDADEARARRALESIVRNGSLQTQLIEDLLDSSQMTAGTLPLELRMMLVAPAVEAALESIRCAAQAKGIRIEAELDRSAGPVRGDAGRLEQIASHLLSNAVKFTPAGGCVHVGLARSDDGVTLVVRDDGEGIDPAFLPFVFERFRQSDPTATRRHGGLGLGLAIVRHVVELHGGSIRAESSGAGCGSTFRVWLPLAAEHPASVDATAKARGRTASLAGVRVLAVEDEPDALELLADVLAAAGASVRPARSSAEALEAVATYRPDVLVCDIGLPDQDGYALIANVRRLKSPALARLPAVALTAYARVEDRVRALAAGYQVHVPKPVDPSDLVVAVARLVADARAAARRAPSRVRPKGG